MCPCTWSWVFGPSFLKLPQYLSTCETGIIGPFCGLDTRVRSHCEIRSWKLWITFHVTVHDLGLFANYPKMPIPTTQKTVVTQSLGDLCRGVRPYLMWKVELKTMDYFRCVLPHDLGCLGLVSQIYLMPKYPKAGITQPTDSVYTRLRSDWMWNLLLKTLY